MNLDINIIEKPQKNIDTEIKLKCTTDVINLKMFRQLEML